ncbi:hypothetical protein COU74_03715 [Candidatus Peregrinibacteria bacterium CG10_big_fil_rev_8_21_14_0_10_36_19]|nr:MAG: hypothetical protein COU74_03715 [Candidatus Peregrinibacteria bacterium CG10_big_fil_rev_8_21_14_0_10_36_19]
MKKSHLIIGGLVIATAAIALTLNNSDLFQGRLSRNLTAPNSKIDLEKPQYDKKTDPAQNPISRIYNVLNPQEKRPTIQVQGGSDGKAIDPCEEQFGGKWETVLEGKYVAKYEENPSTETAKLEDISAKNILNLNEELINKKYKKFCYTQEDVTDTPTLQATRLCDDLVTGGWGLIINNPSKANLSCIVKEKLPKGPTLKDSETYKEDIIVFASQGKYIQENGIVSPYPGIRNYRGFTFKNINLETTFASAHNFFNIPEAAKDNSYLNKTIKVKLSAQINDYKPAAPKPDCYSNPYKVQPRNMTTSYPSCDETPKPYTSSTSITDYPNLITRGELANLIVNEYKKDGIDTTSTDTCAPDTKGHKYGKSMCFLYKLAGESESPIEMWSDGLRPDNFIQRDHATRFITESFPTLKYPDKNPKYNFWKSPYNDLQHPVTTKYIYELWTEIDEKISSFYWRILSMYYSDVIDKNNGWFYPESFLTKTDAQSWVQKAGKL